MNDFRERGLELMSRERSGSGESGASVSVLLMLTVQVREVSDMCVYKCKNVKGCHFPNIHRPRRQQRYDERLPHAC
jgi:hypothetical protein